MKKPRGRTEYTHILFKEWHNFFGKPYIDWFWNNDEYNRNDKYQFRPQNNDLP